jgi:hypothetical protein
LALTLQAGLAAFDHKHHADIAASRWPFGISIAVLGLAVMCLAQLQLGVAWRIGIDWTRSCLHSSMAKPPEPLHLPSI